MADKVMRMAEPPKDEKIQRQANAPAQEPKVQRQEEEKIQKQSVAQQMKRPEEQIQRQAQQEDKVQTKTNEDRQAMPKEKMQRKEQEESIHRQAQSEEKVHTKTNEDYKLHRAAMPEEKIQRKEQEESIQRKENGAPTASTSVHSAITQQTSGGQNLSPDTQHFMESRFNADFSKVKIHSGADAISLNNQLSAKAFTYKNHIFFGRGQYEPGTSDGKRLLAHELTHVVQQGQAPQHTTAPSSTTATQPHVQRLGISDALDYFADAAYNIPGFRMFTIILGVNPINMQQVDRSAANILRAIVEFLPGGNLITRVLDRYGVFDRAGAFVEQQISTLGLTWSTIRNAIDRFLDSLSWSDIFDLGGVWERAKRIFTEPITRIRNFVGSLFSAILQFVRDAVLRPLAALAAGTRGYDLLKALLGQDPLTGDPYPRTAETIIGGFMKLIGQEEVWENIKRGNAVARAWAWFQNALAGLMGFIRQIPTLLITAITSLELQDFLILPQAFAKVFRTFTGFVGQFVSWAGSTVLNLLEILFSVVAPGAMPYLRRAAGAFQSILRNPIGFVGNLIRAVVQGFRNFGSHVLRHLRNSLIQWLTGSLAGANIYIPQALNLREIIKFVLSVLGLTWQNIRGRLVRVLGERVVAALETTVSIVTTLVREGPAAAWEQIREQLSNLQEMVMGQIMNFVTTTIVQRAITTLVTSLNPAGAVIQAIIAIYNTVMFLVERIRQIIRVGRAVLDSIMEIASGAIGRAAQKVEDTMAGLLTLVISFLARFAGLGRISDTIMNIIRRIRQPVDRAIDSVINWLVGLARRLVTGVAQAGVPQDPNERLRLGMQAAVGAVNRFAGRPVGRVVLNPILLGIKTRYGFQTLDLVEQGTSWGIRGVVNPTQILGSRAIIDRGGTTETILHPPLILNFEFRRFTARQTVSRNAIAEGLSHHQNALNNLTVDQWLANIYFRPFLRGNIAAAERNTGRQELMDQLRADIRREYAGRTPPLTEQQIDTLVRLRARGTHASHSADFVAGGNIDEFDSLEPGAINSYIGSAWGRLRPDLESYAHHIRQTLEPRDRGTIKMNFRLRHTFLN